MKQAGQRSAAQAEAEAEAAGAPIALEQALVRRAQRGDRTALRSLLGRHADALYGQVVLPRIGDAATAEDITRATMLTAMEKLHTFRWQGRSIYFWLRQIALNKVIDHHRASQRGQRLARALASESEALGPRMPGPEAALIAEEERRINRARIDRVLRTINPRDREAIQRRLIDDRSREECARRRAVTVGTFDVLLHRALRAFRKDFGER